MTRRRRLTSSRRAPRPAAFSELASVAVDDDCGKRQRRRVLLAALSSPCAPPRRRRTTRPATCCPRCRPTHMRRHAPAPRTTAIAFALRLFATRAIPKEHGVICKSRARHRQAACIQCFPPHSHSFLSPKGARRAVVGYLFSRSGGRAHARAPPPAKRPAELFFF